MDLLEALRAHARKGIYEYDGRTRRWIASVFASKAPLPHLDVAALAMAQELARALLIDPLRGRRLLEALPAEGAAPIAIVGDSHSTQLVRRSARGDRWMAPLHLLCTGASARGLANPTAAAGAGAKVRALLAAAPPMPTVFMFGQVDVEFVHAFKRLESGVSRFDPAGFDAFADETVERYLGFLSEVVPDERRALASIASIFPPALSDAAWRQGYVNAHIADLHGPTDRTGLAGLEIPSLAERTRLHRLFNGKLATAADKAGFGFLDLFTPLLEGDTVRRSLLGRARGANHHLGYAASRGAVLEPLWSVLPT